MKQQVLIVEDEVKLAQLLADYIEHAGFQSEMIHEGNHVVAWVKENEPAIILLDLMIPGMDGLEICKAIRQFSQVPIMIVTARVEEIDRLLGLELSADDYVCKPYSPREVVARVKAILRRLQPVPEVAQPNQIFQLYPETFKVRFCEQYVPLTAIEFKLLHVMASQPDRVFNRQQLMEAIYDDHRIVNDRTVDSHIKKIRKKLECIHDEYEVIQSIYGAGYCFREPTLI